MEERLEKTRRAQATHFWFRGFRSFVVPVLTGLARGRTQEQRRRIQIVFQDPLSSLNPRQRVDAILDGVYQRVGEQIRVSVQLVSVTNGLTLWATKLMGKLNGLIAAITPTGRRVQNPK